jgi:hypothetical protein
LTYGGNIKIKSIHKATDDDIKRILKK